MSQDSSSRYSNLYQTKDGSYTLIHPDLNEMFHSDAGACLEAQSLYIDSSGILEDLCSGESKKIAVFDVGLGLGYNAICTVRAWKKALEFSGQEGDDNTNNVKTDLTILSLEIDPDLVSCFLSLKASWMINWKKEDLDIIKEFKKLDSSSYELIYATSRGTLRWKIALKDGLVLDLAESNFDPYKPFDYIWQDPFSPQKNPSMWSSSWFEKIKKFCSSRVKLMSYSVSGVVKQNLSQAGWKYKKIPTTTQKRNWLMAYLQTG